MARKSLTPRIIGHITDFVRSSNLERGDHLPLQMLADAFRVSRAPVMGALKQLEARGLVRAELNRGYFLAVEPHKFTAHDAVADVDEEGDDAVYFRMAEDRLGNRLGERITENEVMRIYNIPRSQLLRVLRRVAEEGWIERLPGNGWRFTRTLASRKSYEDAYTFRAAIEKQSMLLPTFEPNSDYFRKTRDVQSALIKGGCEQWSRAEIFKANNDFHEMLVACSKNEFFLESIRRINRLRRLIEYHITIDRSRLPNQASEHLHILDLIEDGRRDEAADFIFAHIIGAGRIKAPQV
jgi:DNA-binding GntR family transcriptional regulator